MPFDTLPLRVSRPIAACAPCRRTKSKCDGKLPVCSACEKSGKADQCASNSSDTRETSYVATLETRKAILEKAYADARTRRKSALGLVEAPEIPKSGKRSERRKEAVHVDDLVGDFGLMSISATSRDFYGFTPETSYARFLICSSANVPLPAISAKDLSLPRREDANRMLQEVLARDLVNLPVIDEPTLWSSFNRVYTNSAAKPLDHYLVNVVTAIHAAQRFKISGQARETVDNSSSSRTSESTFALARAMVHSSQVFRPGSVTSIQALLLLAIYAYLDPTHFDYWTIVGFATRAMVDIGMHHEPPKSSSTPKPELDLRRRVYWCVYSLDRLASMAYRRPFSFSDDSTGVAAPSPGSCPPRAAALFKLRQLQSQFYNALYQPGDAPTYDARGDPWAYVWRMHGKLGDWLTHELRHADAGDAAVLELEYCAGCALLLGPSPRCPAPDAHAVALHRQHTSRFVVLARESRELFYLDTLGSMVG